MEYNGWRWKFWGAFDRILLMVVGVPDAWEKESDPQTLIAEMETTPYAWVIFGSEDARDRGIEMFKQRGGVEWNNSRLTLEEKDHEPDAVRWESFNVPEADHFWRILKGIWHIFIALVAWCLLFYMPYAFYMSTSQYDANHQEPSGLAYTILGFVVVGGNAALYVICSIVADGVGFHFLEEMEALYMMLYFLAVMFNVVLDVGVTGYISYLVMVNSGARTWGGRSLGELDTVQDIIESYPIQKTLGYMLFAYSMPATFLTPFIVEPIAIIFTPYHLMNRVVRSNPFLKKWRAERAMSIFAPMDSGRYADILINISLATMILFVPAGWIISIYGGLAASHIYIYLFDHYRVLRCVPGFIFSDATIDLFAWKMTSVPCGFILCAALWKMNCNMTGFGCVRGSSFYGMMLLAFFGHIAIHLFTFNTIVPAMSTKNTNKASLKYEQAAAATAATYFSTNPAYCLRSKYLYQHSPPCGLFVRGKEHMLQPNADAGVYFQDKPAISESFSYLS